MLHKSNDFVLGAFNRSRDQSSIKYITELILKISNEIKIKKRFT